MVARAPGGALRTLKLLSEDPARYDDAAVEGVRRLLGLEGDEPIPAELVADVRMGTTVATNALLERSGTPTLYVTTRGFGDALRIGYQDRPDIFALDIRLPEPAYARVLEVDERVGADGTVVRTLDEDAARRGLEDARRAGFDAVAIAFVHGYAYPEHERRVAELARAAGFSQVSVSHDTSPLMKLVGRGETTVVDAYLSPSSGAMWTVWRRGSVTFRCASCSHTAGSPAHACSGVRTRSCPARRAEWSAPWP